jgi:hypothetical protein
VKGSIDNLAGYQIKKATVSLRPSTLSSRLSKRVWHVRGTCVAFFRHNHLLLTFNHKKQVAMLGVWFFWLQLHGFMAQSQYAAPWVSTASGDVCHYLCTDGSSLDVNLTQMVQETGIGNALEMFTSGSELSCGMIPEILELGNFFVLEGIPAAICDFLNTNSSPECWCRPLGTEISEESIVASDRPSTVPALEYVDGVHISNVPSTSPNDSNARVPCYPCTNDTLPSVPNMPVFEIVASTTTVFLGDDGTYLTCGYLQQQPLKLVPDACHNMQQITQVKCQCRRTASSLFTSPLTWIEDRFMCPFYCEDGSRPPWPDASVTQFVHGFMNDIFFNNFVTS